MTRKIVRMKASSADEAIVLHYYHNGDRRWSRRVALDRLVPIADSCTATIDARGIAYSINLSARASSVGGISMPSALAVGRLITNSNLVDCTTGKSAGLA